MTTETARAYYRRKGWQPSYGHRVKGLGRLVPVVVNGRELIDVEASDARFEATKDPGKTYMADVNAAQRETHRGPDAPQQYQPAPPRDDGAVSKSATYMQAKTAREVYEAKMAQLEYEEKTRKLFPADEAKSHLAGKIAAMREAFLQIPSRLVPVLSAETDPAKIHTLLEDEIVRAMALVNEGAYGRA